jgi:hypothetical protein
MIVILLAQEIELRKILVKDHASKKFFRPYLKKTHQKKRLVESLKWLEHISSKPEDLSSNPSAVKKTKKDHEDPSTGSSFLKPR